MCRQGITLRGTLHRISVAGILNQMKLGWLGFSFLLTISCGASSKDETRTVNSRPTESERDAGGDRRLPAANDDDAGTDDTEMRDDGKGEDKPEGDGPQQDGPGMGPSSDPTKDDPTKDDPTNPAPKGTEGPSPDAPGTATPVSPDDPTSGGPVPTQGPGPSKPDDIPGILPVPPRMDAGEPITIDYTVPEQCVDLGVVATTEYCEIDLNCEDEQLDLVCFVDGPDTWFCNCRGGGQARLVGVKGLAPEDVCPTMLAGCASGEPPVVLEPNEPAECDELVSDILEKSCAMEVGCEREASVGGSDPINIVERESVLCEEQRTGEWRCECSIGGTVTPMGFSGVTDGKSVCPNALDVCGSGDLVRSGAVSCDETPFSRTNGNGNCTAELHCQQPATIGDHGVTIFGDASVFCYGEGDAWSCDCLGGTDAVSVEVTGENNAENACTSALADCVEAVKNSDGIGIE